MESESQTVSIFPTFSTNNLTKQDISEDDIDDFINDVFTNDFESISYEFEILKHHSRSGHADYIYQSIVKKLPFYFRDSVFAEILYPLSVNSLIRIFDFTSKKLECFSELFEGSKYDFDKQKKSSVIRVGFKIMKKCILDDQRLYQTIAHIFTDLYLQFRNQIDNYSEQSEDYKLLFRVTQIIAQLKMEKDFMNVISMAIASDFSENLPTNSGPLFLSSITKILDSELDKLAKFPLEFTKIIALPIRSCLYSKPLEEHLKKFTDEFLLSKNCSALSVISSLVTELNDQKINDKLIEILSEWTIQNTMDLIDRNSISIISDLIDLFFLFQTLVKTHGVIQANYCLKYFKGCLVAYGNRISYLASRYIHQQIQQNNKSFVQRIPDLLNFLIELDSIPYLFTCFRKLLGLRILYYFPEKFMSDSELLNQIGIIFSIDQKNLLNQMYPDLQESNPVCAEFKSPQQIPINFRVMLISVEKWPSYPQFLLNVDDDIMSIRKEFETFYFNKFPNKKIKWIDSLETCVFTYQGYNVIAYSVQYVALTFLKNGRDINETGIPKEYHNEIIISLNRAGILLRKNGKHFFPKLKHPQKTIRINTITLNYPEKIEEKSKDEIFYSQRKRISANIMIALKKKNELKYSKLYRDTQDLLEFPLTENSFKCCLSGLLAQQMIVKGNDKIYRYFPI